MQNLSNTDWKNQLIAENGIVIDVRTVAEYAEGAMPNAVLADIMQPQYFVETISELDKDKSYFVYCKAGMRSLNACTIMVQLGFTKVYNLEGGIMNWNEKLEIPQL